MRTPLGFMLTFRTYGTWLHGDSRGSVDDEHSRFGTPLLPADDRRQNWETSQLRYLPMVFDSSARCTVEAAIRDECTFQNWEPLEINVRSNHVHIVILFAQVSPARMAQRIKARITRWLHERGHAAPDQSVWADGPGSRKHLWTERDLADAALYVREYQDEERK